MVAILKLAAAPQKPNTLLTPAQAGAQAASQALAALKPQQDAVAAQRADAAAQEARDLSAIKGINSAAAASLANIAPSIEGAYSTASKNIGSLASGFSNEEQARLAAANDANRDFTASQGQDMGAPTVDPSAARDVMYDLQGYIPGSALARQGAAAASFGAGIVGGQAQTSRIQADERIAQEHTDEQKFRDQLNTIAAQYPQLRQEALKAIQSYDISKANYERGLTNDQRTYDLNKTKTDAAIKHQERTDATQSAAEQRLEKTLDERTRHDKKLEQNTFDSNTIRNRSLRLQIQKFEQQGRKFDKNRSLANGYATDVNGNAIVGANGKTIPVSPKTFSTGSKSNAFQSAVADAKSLRGHPVKNQLGLGGGAYIAAKGAKGIFPGNPGLGLPATTNDPTKAQYDTQYTFAEAVNYLVDRRGQTRKAARRALISAGWKPDGIRPKGK